MSKMAEALKKVDKERGKRRKNVQEKAEVYPWGGLKMKNSWVVWFFIIGFIVAVLVVFNYQNGKNNVPLSEIFPDEEVIPVDVEYEFVENDAQEQDIQEAPKVDQPEVLVIEKGAPEIKELSKPVVSATQSGGTESKAEHFFTIQVASFKAKNRAEKALAELNKEGHSSAYIVSKDLGAKGVWYRVYIGKYDTKKQTEEFLKEIKKKYKSSFVILY